ncbi:MAG: NAD(P)-dependent oxidoreductase, partial [Planctomycetota bacterium]
MRVLITGGSGFIGGYFAESLRARGDEMVILDLAEPTGPAAGIPHLIGDVRDPEAVRAALTHLGEPVDHVVHLAAAHHDFGIERKTYFDVNEGSARVLGDAMDELGVRDLTFYSTVAIYGDAPEPVTEDSPKQAFTPYGESKWTAEQAFMEWTQRNAADNAGRRCLTIRPTVTFGPRNFANMYSLIRQVAGGKYLQIGPGKNIKSLSYVENIVAATLYLWEKPGGADYDPYNWIDKPDKTSREIGEAVFRSLGKGKPPPALPMWVGLMLGLPFDIVIKLTGKNLPVST